ncbi:MAG: aspartyl/glutamyl-tRNA amidotransferase subunit A, partial [archaeon]|nr:aspartyl/glutamyl-tRNA amidotransferase subunit A [archaeon]
MAFNISQFVNETKNGSVLEHTHKIIEEIEKNNKKFHHFNSFDKKSVLEQAEKLEKQKEKKGKLFGVPISVKDCICVKGLESRAGSKILSGYKPVFDATVITKAKKEGAIILGKTSQDEFGFGTFSVNHTAGENPKNPFDEERSCGGSSGGAAGFTALTQNTHAAIAESTGGSIACPASFCGVASITPTYGIVSRFGLMDYANSLDKIGSMGKTIDDASVLLDVMSGNDPKDSTSLNASIKKQDVKGLRIGLPKELFKSIQDEKLKEIVRKKIDKAESFGAKIEEISLPLNTEYGVAVYYLIAMTEASTNLAKYCGLRYGFAKKLEGNFNEYFSSVRSEAFGEEAKRRIMIGTFARMSGFRDAYYLKAMKARTKLINEYKSIFKKVDVLALPAMPIAAPKFKEIEKLSPLQHYQMDLCTVSPNLCGLPHATINAGFL